MPSYTEAVTESAPSRATSAANSRQPEKVLVFHIGSLGDTLVSLPALTIIREQWPGASITMLYAVTPTGVASPEEILQTSGLIDGFERSSIMRGKLEQIKASLSLWFRLVRKRYDIVVYLMDGERPRLAVFRDWLFFTACLIPRRIGFFVFRREEFIKDESGQSYHQADMFIRRVRNDRNVRETAGPHRLNLPETVREQARQALSTLRHYPAQRPVAVCPGCKQPANSWPIERFTEICRRLRERGFDVVVLGGPAEVSLGKQICRAVDGILDFCGQTNVLESAALIAECAFLIGLDTGTTHLAAAVSTPCVAVYGARNIPGRWTPLGDRHITLRQSPPCAGCNQPVCSVPGHPCMTSIDVEMTWRAVTQMTQPSASYRWRL
jgi:heptosyltransferase III